MTTIAAAGLSPEMTTTTAAAASQAWTVTGNAKSQPWAAGHRTADAAETITMTIVEPGPARVTTTTTTAAAGREVASEAMTRIIAFRGLDTTTTIAAALVHGSTRTIGAGAVLPVMDEERHREISAMGGRASHRRDREDDDDRRYRD
jgi:hypothetical protein